MTASIKPSRTPFILGVGGGSGSGKTYFAQDLTRQLGPDCSEIIYQDNFYFDQSGRFDFDGGSVNFDHPDSIDFASLASALRELKAGRDAEIPTYDFATHKRKAETLKIQAKPVIVVDGILIFHNKAVRDLLDDQIYFSAPEELRFQRRLQRDVHERGRKAEGVKRQFVTQVKPMHDQFVEPSKKYARVIVSEELEYSSLLMALMQKLGAKE